MPDGLRKGGGVGCGSSRRMSCAERAKQGTGAKEGLGSDKEGRREAEVFMVVEESGEADCGYCWRKSLLRIDCAALQKWNLSVYYSNISCSSNWLNAFPHIKKSKVIWINIVNRRHAVLK
jgi:hypothetical protein